MLPPALARAAGVDRRTLRDWAHRWGAEGPPGLRDRRRPGREPRASPEREAGPVTAADRGPGPEWDPRVGLRPSEGRLGVSRHRVDLQALIEQRSGVRLHERPVAKVPRRLGL